MIRINRNILECKFNQVSVLLNAIVVLIETYWNVNEEQGTEEKGAKIVLIETYWNVNSASLAL